MPSSSLQRHVLYLHIEKTGGSAIECATEGNPLGESGLWTNMGHTSKDAVQHCTLICMAGGINPFIVVSIREPYAWWRSNYRYSWVGTQSARKTNNDFHFFVTQSQAKDAQSAKIASACGQPCRADFILHTETLADDWQRLLQLLGWPPTLLPRTNPTSVRPDGSHPPAVSFSREIVAAINTLDANMFTEFGYPSRTDAPFSLEAPKSPPPPPHSPFASVKETTPDEQSLLASPVAEAINARFHHPKHGSNLLEDAGVIVHMVDGYEEYGKPWQMACTPSPSCSWQSDRISASIIHKGRPGSYGPDAPSGAYRGKGGIILRPASVTLLCGYPGDGNTRRVTCQPPGVSSTCIPGCIQNYRVSIDNSADPWQRWCDIADHTGQCEGDLSRPWRPADLGALMHRDQSSPRKAAYNELVIDGPSANAQLPTTIEAFFMLPTDPHDGQVARDAHRNFLATYPNLKAQDVPLLVYRPEDPNGPFVLPDASQQHMQAAPSNDAVRGAIQPAIHAFYPPPSPKTGDISELGFG